MAHHTVAQDAEEDGRSPHSNAGVVQDDGKTPYCFTGPASHSVHDGKEEEEKDDASSLSRIEVPARARVMLPSNLAPGYTSERSPMAPWGTPRKSTTYDSDQFRNDDAGFAEFGAELAAATPRQSTSFTETVAARSVAWESRSPRSDEVPPFAGVPRESAGDDSACPRRSVTFGLGSRAVEAGFEDFEASGSEGDEACFEACGSLPARPPPPATAAAEMATPPRRSVRLSGESERSFDVDDSPTPPREGLSGSDGAASALADGSFDPQSEFPAQAMWDGRRWSWSAHGNQTSSQAEPSPGMSSRTSDPSCTSAHSIDGQPCQPSQHVSVSPVNILESRYTMKLPLSGRRVTVDLLGARASTPRSQAISTPRDPMQLSALSNFSSAPGLSARSGAGSEGSQQSVSIGFGPVSEGALKTPSLRRPTEHAPWQQSLPEDIAIVDDRLSSALQEARRAVLAAMDNAEARAAEEEAILGLKVRSAPVAMHSGAARATPTVPNDAGVNTRRVESGTPSGSAASQASQPVVVDLLRNISADAVAEDKTIPMHENLPDGKLPGASCDIIASALDTEACADDPLRSQGSSISEVWQDNSFEDTSDIEALSAILNRGGGPRQSATPVVSAGASAAEPGQHCLRSVQLMEEQLDLPPCGSGGMPPQLSTSAAAAVVQLSSAVVDGQHLAQPASAVAETQQNGGSLFMDLSVSEVLAETCQALRADASNASKAPELRSVSPPLGRPGGASVRPILLARQDNAISSMGIFDCGAGTDVLEARRRDEEARAAEKQKEEEEDRERQQRVVEQSSAEAVTAEAVAAGVGPRREVAEEFPIPPSPSMRPGGSFRELPDTALHGILQGPDFITPSFDGEAQTESQSGAISPANDESPTSSTGCHSRQRIGANCRRLTFTAAQCLLEPEDVWAPDGGEDNLPKVQIETTATSIAASSGPRWYLPETLREPGLYRQSSALCLHSPSVGNNDDHVLRKVASVGALPSGGWGDASAQIAVRGFQDRMGRSRSQKTRERNVAAEFEQVSHLYDGEILFDMLDLNHDGALNRREARSWFRGMGWCLDDSSIDEILDEILQAHSGAAHSAFSPIHTVLDLQQQHRLGLEGPDRPPKDRAQKRSWRLAHLLESAERHKELCGPDGGSLLRSLRLLVGDSEVVAKDFLWQRMVDYESGIEEPEFVELLDLCGVPTKARWLQPDALARQMVDNICEPRAVAGNLAAQRTWRGLQN